MSKSLSDREWRALAYLARRSNRDRWVRADELPRMIFASALDALCHQKVGLAERKGAGADREYKATLGGVSLAREVGLRSDGRHVDDA